MIASMNYKEGLVKIMELKIGDFVEFKRYEDLSFDEMAMIDRKSFPKSGKVKEIIFGNEKVIYFFIEGSQYSFGAKSVARVISDDDGADINSLKPGDEVLIKANVNEIFGNHIYVTSKADKKSVVKILKRKEPEYFIVQEDYYGMYIGTAQKLVSDKSEAIIYTSRNTANEDAADMHLSLIHI